MGKLYTVLDERLRQFISEQPVFFVATSPCLSARLGQLTVPEHALSVLKVVVPS
jgi:hypothetical protein